jgi:hypothetical protein
LYSIKIDFAIVTVMDKRISNNFSTKKGNPNKIRVALWF